MDTTPIKARFHQIRRSLELLGEIRKHSRQEFVSNAYFTSTGERQLQIAIQAAIEVGQYVLSALGLDTPANYADVFAKLAAAGVVPHGLALRMAGMARFRNLLVHLYMEVDEDRVFTVIREDLGDLSAFVEAVTTYVASAGGLEGEETWQGDTEQP
jgi:uncharacterized protein YutE (UPF0331/DUF86 family)